MLNGCFVGIAKICVHLCYTHVMYECMYLLEVVWQFVNLNDKILKWPLSGPFWIEEQEDLFLGSIWPALKHFKCLRYSPIYTDDEPHNLRLVVPLA